MIKKLPIKAPLILVPLMLLTTSAVGVESSKQHQNIYKQLGIMSDIIKSSVSDKSANKRMRINKIQSMYLQDQGVVFTIHSNASARHWRDFSFNFAMPELPEMPAVPSLPQMPNAPEAPAAPHSDDEHAYADEITETIEEAFESATVGYEEAMEAFEMAHEQQRDLREQQRDLAYEIRDVGREKRDMNYQLSRASEQKKSELKKALKELKEQEKSLRLKQKELAKANNVFIEQKKQQRKQQLQERGNYFQKLTASLADTLCLYGNGLKALPKDEHVSIILKSAGAQSGHRYQDSILVFNKKDIMKCSSDKIDATALLNKSKRYQF